jgi:choline kinase
LLRCADALRGKSFYKLDGDLLFDPLIVERLSVSKCPLSVAVDGKRKLDEEAMKVIVGNSREILKFGKAIPVAHAHGESIGIERLSAAVGEAVLDSIDELEHRGIVDRYYEDVYASLIDRKVIAAEAVEVGDLAWTEVDCPDDLEKARVLFS